jgi:erythromycin esterase-like protein
MLEASADAVRQRLAALKPSNILGATMPENSVEILKDAAIPLDESKDAADVLLRHIPEEAEWVLIGETSHGNHECFQLRSDLTKLLIEQRGFSAVATEADFPDAFRVNLWAQGLSARDSTAEEALSDFTRFPTWMWRNREVVHFLQWLHAHNAGVAQDQKRERNVGFYGMDIYSLAASTDAVIKYLEEVDPDAAQRAHKRYGCFDKFGADAISYAFSLAKGNSSCEADAVGALVDLLEEVGKRKHEVQGKLAEEEAAFAAVSNARIVKAAESYYRSMFFASELTWNIRDKHMAETAGLVAEHLRSRDANPKVVVWAHNSHVGDARDTCMGRRRGEVNLGQLLREKYGEDKVFNVGQIGYHGQVAAADEWGADVKIMDLTTPIDGSHEAVLHEVGIPTFGLNMRDASPELSAVFKQSRLQRSVGVIYQRSDPEIEKSSHYFTSWLERQFDLLVFRTSSSAITPLEGDTTGKEGDLNGGEDGEQEDGKQDGKQKKAGGGPGTFPFGE